MAFPRRHLTIVDVGHGNCAIVSTPDGTVIIDVGLGNAVQESLAQLGVTEIDAVLLSHADQDHVGGLVGLLSDGRFRIKRVRINSDASKRSDTWDDLLFQLEAMERDARVDFMPALSASSTGEFDLGDVRIEIAGPGAVLAGKGPGSLIDAHLVGVSGRARKMSSNSASAVVRICVGTRPVALLMGDVDELGLDSIEFRKVDLRAPIAVYPHHGGASRDDPAAFASRVCELVQPVCIVFSIGREKHENPRPEIVRAVRAHGGVRIACTQLSKHCATSVPDAPSRHLSIAYARGRESRQCCMGSMTVDLDAPENIWPSVTEHLKFISSLTASALCRSSDSVG